MRPADVVAVAAIYAEGIADRIATFETEPPGVAEVSNWPTDGPVVVAERDGEVLAWARAMPYRPERSVYAGVAEFSVYTARGARRIGAGRAVLSGLISSCRAAGYWKLLSRVFPENVASLALCQGLGFREVGRYRRHARLDGRWRDVVIVELLIDESRVDQPRIEVEPAPGPNEPGPNEPGPNEPGPNGLGGAVTGRLAVLRAQALAVEAALGPDVLRAEVPGCPGYTVAEVLRHLGVVHRLVSAWILAGRRPRDPAARAPDGDPRDWFSTGWRDLERVLASAPVDAPVATWNPADTTMGFWQRRMAHELAVHAFDVLAAAGAGWHVPDAFALDGIDEALRLWLGTRLGGDVGAGGDAIRVVAGGQTWTVGLHAMVVEVHDRPVDVDAVLSGDPAAVYLWLWGRELPRGGVEVAGDAAVAETLRRLLARAMQ